jgi:hypothetical protein
MAEVRRNRRVVESVDPVTGEKTYRDETTGEVVNPDTTVVTPEATVVQTGRSGTTERVVTEQNIPPDGQVVTQRTVAGPAANAQTQESSVYTDDPYAYRRERSYKIQQAIYLLFGILEALLAIRFVLRLLAANPNSGFASAIYSITAPFMAPFVGVFGEPAAGGSVVEFNALVAIIVYALIAWVLVKVVWLVGGETRTGVRTSRVHTRIDQ